MERFGGLEYRLGDLFYGSLERRGVRVEHVFCDRWPSSVGCAYARTKRLGSRGDWAALRAALAVRSASLAGPDNHTLVVHLRLGDVLDMPIYVHRHGCSAASGCAWVRPVADYSRLIVPPEVRLIEIVGNATYRVGSGCAKSREYVRRVHGALSRVRPTRALRTLSADEDLAYMASSGFFLPSRGRFSRLATDLVRERGGKIVTVAAGCKPDSRLPAERLNSSMHGC